jgi:hypothetical protein
MLKGVLLAFGFGFFGLAAASSAHAAWGCGAQNSGGAWGDSFNESSKSAAEKSALSGCEQSRQPGEPKCRIVGCNPNINTGDQADALWELK